MRRVALQILAALVIGAMACTAVAWACAMWANAPMAATRKGFVRLRTEGAEVLWWPDNIPEPTDPVIGAMPRRWFKGDGEFPIDLWSGAGFGVRTGAVFRTALEASPIVLHHQCGWPCPAFACTGELSPVLAGFPGRTGPDPAWTSALPVPAPIATRTTPQRGPVGPYDRPLPAALIWSGFLLNTGLFAGGAWLIVGGPWGVRRAVRLVRNRCLACGYPIGVSAVCTECGRPVRVHGGGS